MNSYIHLIRHGITAGNENRWYYGRMDIPLTARGIAQLEKLRADGIYPNVQNADCYTSGMLRTEQTFQTIYGDLPHKTLPLLREMNFGAWEGMSFEEIEQDTAHKAAFDDWMRVTDGSFAFRKAAILSTAFMPAFAAVLPSSRVCPVSKSFRAVTTETTQSPS